MKKNRLLPIGLTVSLLGLGAWIYLNEFDDDKTSEKAQEGQVALFSGKVGDIKQIRIDNLNGSFLFERSSGSWRMKEPKDLKADARGLDAIVSQIKNAKSERKLEDTAGRLSAFGLETPSAKITVIGSLGEERLDMGGEGPFGGNYYVRRGDGVDVFLTSEPIRGHLGGNLYDYRDKRIADFELSAIERISLSGLRIPPMRILKQGKTFVAASGEANFRLNRDLVEDMLLQLKVLEAVAFTEEPLTPESNEAILKVELLLSGEETPLEIVFYSHGDSETADEAEVLARFGDGTEPAPIVKEKSINAFHTTLDFLRDRKPLSFERWMVDRLEVKDGNRHYLAKKTGFEWSIEPKDKSFEVLEIGTFLSALDSTNAYRFIDKPGALSAYGLSDPALAITVGNSKEKSESHLIIGEENGQLYAKSRGDETIYELDPELLTELQGILGEEQN